MTTACFVVLSGLLGAHPRSSQGQVLDRPPRVQIAEGDWTCRNCVRTSWIRSLGDTAISARGPDALEGAQFVALDGSGSYWVAQTNSFKVFDSAGRFIEEVGRRGQGPGEFQNYPGPAFPDPQGNIHIVDVRNARESVFNTDRELIGEYRLSMGVYDGAALPKAGARVISASLRSARHAGLPLHIMNASEIRLSFGATVSDEVVRDFDLRRIVHANQAGHICAALHYEYVISCWDDNGRATAVFEGRRLNEAPVEPGLVTMAEGPPNKIVDIYVTDAAQLWVLRQERARSWRSHVEEAVLPDGAIGIRTLGDPSKLFAVYLDVLDRSTGRVMVTGRVPPGTSGFLGQGLLWQIQLTELGVPVVKIWRVEQ